MRHIRRILFIKASDKSLPLEGKGDHRRWWMRCHYTIIEDVSHDSKQEVKLWAEPVAAEAGPSVAVAE